MPDTAQSVLDRLRNKARATGKSVQLVLQLFCQEEFLRRLALSPHRDKLILKGGLLLYSISGFSGRPTMDLDLLAKSLRADSSSIMRVVDDICRIATGNDYVTFEIGGAESIAELREYSGVRVHMRGLIKNTKTAFHIDVGVDDVIVPKPIERSMPTQLDGFTEPSVLSYSLESTVAERLDAIISRLELNSRMKDFHDIYYLAGTVRFDARTLQEAIYQTLQHRGTPVERDTLRKVRTLSCSDLMQARWKRFSHDRLGYLENWDRVLEVICALTGPCFDAITSEREIFGTWNPDLNRYEALEQ